MHPFSEHKVKLTPHQAKRSHRKITYAFKFTKTPVIYNLHTNNWQNRPTIGSIKSVCQIANLLSTWHATCTVLLMTNTVTDLVIVIFILLIHDLCLYDFLIINHLAADIELLLFHEDVELLMDGTIHLIANTSRLDCVDFVCFTRINSDN